MMPILMHFAMDLLVQTDGVAESKSRTIECLSERRCINQVGINVWKLKHGRKCMLGCGTAYDSGGFEDVAKDFISQ